MAWILLAAGAVFVLLIVEAHKTGGIALPVMLRSTGPGGSGETALQQESQGAEETGAAVAGDVATGNFGGAAAAAVGGLISQITQHSARLAAAKAENSAIPPAVQAFDADLQAIAAAYAQGKATPIQVVLAVTQLAYNVYGNLHGLVGKPGTAWPANAPAPTPTSLAGLGPGIPCNTKCTAACCLFYNDLAPPLVVVSQAMQGVTPGIDFQAVAGGFVVTVPKVYPPDDPAYGSFTRPSYQLAFVRQQSSPASLLASII